MKKILQASLVTALLASSTLSYATEAVWAVGNGADGRSKVVTTSNNGHTIGMQCDAQSRQCLFFVEDTQCTPDSGLPLLVNSSKQVGVYPAVCAEVETTFNTITARVIANPVSLMPFMQQQEEVTVTWPQMKANKFNTVTFPFQFLTEDQLNHVFDSTI